MRKALFASLAAALLFACIGGCGGGAGDGGADEPGGARDVFYQVSTLGALSRGVFDGEVDYAALRQHGDFGIGTFQGLDGEMVALDGRFWQVRTDSLPIPASDSQKAPFAMLTFFDEDIHGAPPPGLDYAGLQQFSSGLFPSPNYFYAVRVEGEFAWLKIRSVPGQQPPYPVLADVVAKQTVWELEGVRGTMVGFYCPSYLGGVNQGGFHLHFISDDLRSGGHVLDCRTGEVELIMDLTDGMELALPEDPGFRQASL